MTAQRVAQRTSERRGGRELVANGAPGHEHVGLVTRRLLELGGVEAACGAATDFAPAPGLALEPDWSFASAAEARDPLAQARREIWNYFAERRLECPIAIPWLEGLQLRLFLGNDLSWCVYVGGAFEPNEFVFWKTILKPGMVFVDGGANEGVYTIFAARLVGSDGIVLAIEPSTREIARLATNVAENDLTNVRVLPCALGAGARRAVLAVAEYGHEGQNALGRAVPNRKVRTVAHDDVAVKTLDRIAASEQLTRIDGIKLDLEGAEGRALHGATATLERFRPLIQLELNDEALRAQRSSRLAVVEMLDALDYRLFVFDRKTAQLRPRRNLDELRLNVIAAPAGWRPPELPARG